MNMFQEANGKTSMMRVMMFATVLGAIAIGVLSVVKDRDLLDAACLVTPYIAAAFTGKVAQRNREVPK